MKILYGVQGTGNGHLSRARAMAEAFKQYPDIDITWLFSGRAREDYFEMQAFGDFECRRGLTFFTQNGKIKTLDTVFRNQPARLINDIKALDISSYDRVISDYEPVTAWALRRAKRDGLGIGHQYAFNHQIPIKGSNLITRTIMKKFAPMPRGIGLHWFHFGQAILPPIVDIKDCTAARTIHNKVLVYLPFENNQALLKVFEKFTDFEFYVYAPGLTNSDFSNCHSRALSQQGFKKDLSEASWVICNSGFELISEALQLGKRIMSKPLVGQMEQLSNAAALEQLGLATVEQAIDHNSLDFWFSCEPSPVQIQYPDVAAALAKWINAGCNQSIEQLSTELWNNTTGLDQQGAHENQPTPQPFL